MRTSGGVRIGAILIALLGLGADTPTQKISARGLSFLAPDIVTAIFNGRHPAQLTANRLMEDTRLPLEWKAQRELFCLL